MTTHLRLQSRLLATALMLGLAGAVPAAPLKTLQASTGGSGALSSIEGRVEALRQSVVAAQVAGAIVQLDVKAGDRVRAGQILMRIDARAAEQAATASEAQAHAARAGLQLASREFERQQLLHKQQFISQAALDQAEAQFKATQAQLNAQIAQLGVARTQSGQHIVRSPFDGVLAEVPVMVGDMALPGRALATIYDPRALRVTADVPQSQAAALGAQAALLVEIPGLPGAALKPLRSQVLPVVDAASHTMQLRLDLPASLAGVVPGQFARVLLPAGAAAQGRLMLPRSALVRRAELDALYVLDGKGQPLLRQVRLGAVRGEQVEILSGLLAGEQVVLEPQLAARIR